MAATAFSISTDAMLTFLESSRGSTRDEIIKNFHRLVLNAGHFSEAGSVLLNYPEDRKLRLFDPQFLIENGYLKAGEPWQIEFEYGQGIAGEAFNIRESILVENVATDTRFSVVEGQVPIGSMICAPIIVKDRDAPFGVASFHNKAPNAFSADAKRIAETYVAVLGIVLAAAPGRAEQKAAPFQRRVFIGCAREDISMAQIIQNHLRHDALVKIWNQGAFKAGGYILETLLRLVKEFDCAIFLVTPNDVVRHRGQEYLVARDNVLFEAGLFFSQLGRGRTFLIVPRISDLTLPSDLDGLINLTYTPTVRASDLEMALAPVCNDIIQILQNPLPPVM